MDQKKFLEPRDQMVSVKPAIVPIYYLAQKYSGEAAAAFQRAQGWVYHLQFKLGLNVYSPILESHPVWVYLTTMKLKAPAHDDWVKRDLIKCEMLKANLQVGGMIFASDCWVGEDEAGCNKPTNCEQDQKECNLLCKYQWASKGAYQEYLWARANGIPCYCLFDVLNHKWEQVT